MPVPNLSESPCSANGGGEKHHRRSIYLLPNLITTAALFCGFYAIVAAGSTGKFVNAAIAIFVAMVLDGLDGRVARMTKTQSEFGKQYDSISDMVCFGVAPALIVYEWSLSGLIHYGTVMGKISWLAAFIYAVCAALRLARFNILSPSEAKEHFLGLASPAAAALIMGGIWFGQEMGVRPKSLWVMSITLFVTVAAALMMVSNFRYYSLKLVEKVNQVSFLTIVMLIFVFIAIWIAPAYVLFGLAVVYAVSGPLFSRRCCRLQRERGGQGLKTSAEECTEEGEDEDEEGCDCECDEEDCDGECDDEDENGNEVDVAGLEKTVDAEQKV